MKITVRHIIISITLGLLGAVSASADMPENYLKRWNDPAVQKRINDGIEKNRKGNAILHIVDSNGASITNAEVVVSQQSHEFLFGCNLFVLGQLDSPELNRKYEEAFANLFNFATIPFYWADIEPEENKLRLEEGSPRVWRRPPPDRLVKWCKAHGIKAKGHALLYLKSMFMPKWIDRNDPQTLKKLATKHMEELAERYKFDIAQWDVINEELPRSVEPDAWHVVPEDYQAWAFEEAGRLFPEEVQLLLNDGVQQSHVTTNEYEKIIQGLLDRKVRIEGIGMQFHTGLDSYSPQQMFDTYEQLGRLGLPLYITEITIPGTGSDGPAQQGTVVAKLYRLWFSTPSMAGVTWWNLADGTAFENENKSLGGLLDKNFDPKPAYKALDQLINHDWKTNLETKSDVDGNVKFRGFFGKYSIKVTAGDLIKEFEIDLSKNSQAEFTLTIKE